MILGIELWSALGRPIEALLLLSFPDVRGVAYRTA